MGHKYLIELGLILLLGLVGSKLISKLKVPQILGSVLVGLALGPELLGWISSGEIDALRSVLNPLTLALIGFGIGSELTLDRLRRLGRAIFLIATFETMMTGLLIGAACYPLGGEVALPLALLLAALGMATGPTTTAAMMREVRAAGPVTTAILAVVGIDQVIGLVAFAAALPLAVGLTGATMANPLKALGLAGVVIVVSPIVGALVGLAIDLCARSMRNRGELMVVTLAVMCLVAGTTKVEPIKPYCSLLLITLFAGAVLVNRNRVLTHRVFEATSSIMPVIYILFFALAGAKIELAQMQAIGVVGTVYVVARCVGKWLGSWAGGCVAGDAVTPRTRKLFGLGLFSQGGVAIALALTAGETLRQAGGGPQQLQLATSVEAVMLGSTLVLWILGPPAVRWAIERVGEAGKARAM